MPAKTQTHAIIYLADQRGCSQSHWHRSHYTFNFGSYQHENRSAFGSLRILNDETLKSGYPLCYSFDENMLILLLPVVGGLNYQHNRHNYFIEAGESRLIYFLKGETLEMTNPYEEDLINFLCIGWHNSAVTDTSHYQFDLDNDKNRLTSFPLFSIGKFGGREEGIYQLKNSNKGVIVVVIEGAFEVQNRLLQHRDGLALWNTEEVEFEALSEGAILLFLETEEH